MAYTPVPTVVTGDTWTAANANTYWRDNFAAGVPDLFEAAGDLVYSSGANAASRLALGSKGNILIAGASAPSWSLSRLGCRVSRTSALTDIANSVYTSVPFDAEDYDDDNMHNNSTNPERITFNTAGRYMIGWHLRVAGLVTLHDYCIVRIWLNGSISIARDDINQFDPAMATGFPSFGCTTRVFSANDYIELQVYPELQSGNADLSHNSPYEYPYFWAQMV